ncbi:sodium:solute symporter family protein, partial [candidate division KSB1 bacterium]|nr:sodium:solute symporter family protein [candidate division KSB1 bacterium]
IVLGIGMLSHRMFRGTGEDYFVASRSIGPFLLLMSLFGTNMTAFAILGASGEAYHTGIGVFGLMASSSALVIPLVFYFVGTRLWSLGKKYGYLTQVQFFRDRWRSDGVGLALFAVLIALVIPYLLIGVMGGGITLNQITDGQIPTWIGGLLVCVIVFIYVTYSGARGTAWVNTFQTLVFMTLGGVAFAVIVNKYGGLASALEQVREVRPNLLIFGENIKPLKLLTFMCIPLSAGMFPHIFMHWLTAKNARSFRYPVIFYPVCIAVVWIPSVLLGMMGVLDFPDLQGPAANSVLVQMVARHAPGFLGGLLGAGVFAAIMSSLDSQSLSIGTMFTQDIVRHYGFHDKMSESQQVLFGRLFVTAILALTFFLSLITQRSIFKLAVWSFSGYAALFPVILAALFWKRSTKWGAAASILSVVLLWIYFFRIGWENPEYTVGGVGMMPVAIMLGVSALAMVVGSLLSRPPEQSVINRFFAT